VLFFFLKTPKFHVKSKEVHMFEHLGRGFKTIKSTPSLLFVFFHEILIFIPGYVFNEYSQPLFVDLGIPVPLIGLIIAIASLFSFFLMRNLTKITNKLQNIKTIFICDFLILAAFVGLIFWTSNIIVVLLAYYILRLLGLVRSPIFSQIKNDYIPSGSRSTTLSLLSMIDSLLDVVILVSLSMVADIGLNVIFTGCLILVILGIFSPVKLMKKRIKWKLFG